MDPLLIDVPTRIETERLVLRCPRPGDGAAINAAVCASVDVLGAWMPWARQAPTLDESEAYCRRQQARFLLREDLVMLIFEKGSEAPEDPLLGACGLHRIDWAARCFEIGYWRRVGLGARRVEIRVDDRNERSWKVAERAGFTLEALLRANAVTPTGEPRDTRVYARVRGAEEPAEAPAAPPDSARPATGG